MAYTIAANAVLGAGKTGLTIGYRLVDVDGVEVLAFTITNVTETSIAGTYTVTGGVSVPDGFVGRIIWGESGTDYAEATIQDADHILKRGMAHVEDDADNDSLTELVLAALNAAISGATLTVKKTDGSTFNTHTVTLDSEAVPIVGVD
ncbi:MAG: hypothetical protein J5I93_28545 [Pirellulaceae bacterium]|nr:hypothetical protein [Pirellulaceae bacterium]